MTEWGQIWIQALVKTLEDKNQTLTQNKPIVADELNYSEVDRIGIKDATQGTRSRIYHTLSINKVKK